METHLKNPELKEVSLGKDKRRKLRDYDHVILQTFNIFSGFLADLVLRATNEIYNIASRAAQSNSVYVSVLKILIVHADSVSKLLRYS